MSPISGSPHGKTVSAIDEPGPPKFAEMRVGAAMHRGVITCQADTPLRSVARIMAAHRVHCVVVREDGSERGADPSVWRVISDLDFIAAVSRGDVPACNAGELASSPALMVGPHETLVRAARLMSEHETSHLVVVQPSSGRPVGVLSALDVADAVAATS